MSDINMTGEVKEINLLDMMGGAVAADADMWKREAILNIRDYFGSELPEEMRDDIIILA